MRKVSSSHPQWRRSGRLDPADESQTEVLINTIV
jgi:hypothetical protein